MRRRHCPTCGRREPAVSKGCLLAIIMTAVWATGIYLVIRGIVGD